MLPAINSTFIIHTPDAVYVPVHHCLFIRLSIVVSMLPGCYIASRCATTTCLQVHSGGIRRRVSAVIVVAGKNVSIFLI